MTARLVVVYAGEEPMLKGERIGIEHFAQYWEDTPWHGDNLDWRIVDDFDERIERPNYSKT